MSILKTIKGAIAGDYDFFNYYYGLMNLFSYNKLVQEALFNMYRAAESIEKIKGIPEDMRCSITAEMIQEEIENQSNSMMIVDANRINELSKKYSISEYLEIISKRFDAWEEILLKKYYDEMFLPLTIDFIFTDFSDLEEGTAFSSLDSNQEAMVLHFSKLAPLLFECCKWNIVDVFYDTDRFEQASKKLEDEISEIYKLYIKCEFLG